MAVRPAAKVVLDNPDADGRIDKFGYGRTWRFDARQRVDPITSWRHDEVHLWELEDCEIIPPLECLTLLAYAKKADMVLGTGAGQWIVTNGSQGTPSDYWRAETLGGRPAVDWLSYYDGSADQWGEITSVDDFLPAFMVWCLRFQPPPDQTEPAWLEIIIQGDSTQPTQVSYAWTFPMFDDSTLEPDARARWQRWKYPLLWRRYRRQYVWTDWEVVAGLDRADAAARAADDSGSVYRLITIRDVDGAMVVSMDGVGDYWLYEPPTAYKSTPTSDVMHDLRMQRGKVQIALRGGAGFINCQPLEWTAGGTAKPLRYHDVDSIFTATVPTGSEYHAVEGDRSPYYYSGKDVTLTNDAGATGQHRPQIELGRVATYLPPVVYATHLGMNPIWAAARSSPEASDARTELIKLDWRRRWPRDWQFRATLRDPSDHWLTRVHKYGKVDVTAGWDTTADTAIGTFYLDEPRWERDALDDHERTIEISGRDIIMARLVGKQFMAWRTGPEGWNLEDWARWVLLCAELPLALQQVADWNGGIGVVDRKHRKLEDRTRHTDSVVRALDKVLARFKWSWWVRTDGVVEVGPTPTYTHAAMPMPTGVGGLQFLPETLTPDFVLDEDAQTSADHIRRIRIRPGDDYRNYSAVFLGDDEPEVGLATDQASHQTPADALFTGVSLWDVASEPLVAGLETTLGQAERDERATERLRLLQQRGDLLEWQTIGKPDLAPGMFVELQVDIGEVAAGTIFQIIEDIGTMEPNAMRFDRTIRGRIVAEYTP